MSTPTNPFDRDIQVSLWVGQFGSREAVEEYVSLRQEDTDGEPVSNIADELGLSAVDIHECLEVRYEPGLWQKGEAAFAGFSWGRLFGPGAIQLASRLGAVPFDTALLVVGYNYLAHAEEGEQCGRVRFIGTFDLLPEPE